MTGSPHQATDLPDEIREVFEKPVPAFLALKGPDGFPHVSPVWVDVEDGQLTFNTVVGRAKHRYLGEDDRVAISAEDPDQPYRPAMVRGRARMTTEGADEHIDRLAKKYVGHDRYQWRQPGEVRVKVVIDHVASAR
jgi:PPOX class probable F420-dependent enzyme